MSQPRASLAARALRDKLDAGRGRTLTITLNGDRFEIARPLTVSELLAQLDIDARRVAVEHNLTVLKRDAFDRVIVNEGDAVEIVNFVGGGSR